MRLIYAGILLSIASLGFADTITLKSGRVIEGTYLGGTARTVRVDDGENVRTLDVSDIAAHRVWNGGGGYSTSRNSDRPPSQSADTAARRRFQFQQR